MRKWPLTLKVWSAKTSISCETSFKFHKAIFIKLNKYDFCEASATFQDTHQMLRLPRKKDALALTRFQRLRLSRKTRKQPPILWLGSAKTSISCETSSTFHTLKERIVSQCVCTAQWREINDAATTTRRRHDQHDQHDANTGPTPDPNYKREPFATHPGKSGIQTTHLQITWWPCPFLMPSCSNWLIQNLQGCFRGCFELVFF